MSNTTLKVNGGTHTVDVEPSTPLLYILRNDLGLARAAVRLRTWPVRGVHGDRKGQAVRSCITPVSAVKSEITTLEGLSTQESCTRCSRPGLMSRFRSAAFARTGKS